MKTEKLAPTPAYGTLVDGKVRIILGTYCSVGCCIDGDCDFPACAHLSDDSFENIEDAQKKYPGIEIV